jgi:AcrR family transcriptional regulator
MARRADGERKRALILDTALRCFRDKGFDETTMRDIAREGGISVGSAYHYFPSKAAIVVAYYDLQQARHEELALARLEDEPDLRARLGIAFQTKIEAVRKDRELLIAISRSLADPSDPLSAFSEESREVRERAIAVFRAAVDVPAVREENREMLAAALWAAHLVALAYLVRDTSRAQRKTKKLIDDLLDLFTPVFLMLQGDLFAPTWTRLREILEEAGVS